MPTFPLVADGLTRLAARGITHLDYYYKGSGLAKRGDEPPPFPNNMPAWGAAVLMLTTVIGVVVLMTLQYTIGDVITTLAMIETPAATVTFTENDEPDNTLDKEQKESLLEQATTVTITPVKPITSSIRSTWRHLHAIGGFRAKYRGIVPAILYSIALTFSTNLFSAIVPGPIAVRLVLPPALAALSLARLHMAWTHAMISTPSPLRWYQRMAPLSAYRSLWLPTLVAHVSGIAAIFVTVTFSGLASSLTLLPTLDALRRNAPVTSSDLIGSVATVVGIFAFAVSMCIGVVLPAHVTLVRVEASMLPEDQETIVPFDRSFNGKVVPKVLGGTGAVGFVNAWATFNWEARWRIVRLYLLNLGIQVVYIISMFHVIGFEVAAIMGRDVREWMGKMNKWQKEHAQ